MNVPINLETDLGVSSENVDNAIVIIEDYLKKAGIPYTLRKKIFFVNKKEYRKKLRLKLLKALRGE